MFVDAGHVNGTVIDRQAAYDKAIDFSVFPIPIAIGGVDAPQLSMAAGDDDIAIHGHRMGDEQIFRGGDAPDSFIRAVKVHATENVGSADTQRIADKNW